jgi:hypothetical protein
MNSCNGCGALERSAFAQSCRARAFPLCPLVEPIPPAYDVPPAAREQGNAVARGLVDELLEGKP